MSWRGFGHQEIYEMVVNGGNGVGIADAAKSAWDAANTAVNDAEQGIGAALNASQAEWQGIGADAMRSAYSPLMQWAVQAATSAARTAGGVNDQAAIASETQRHVAANPPPQNLGQHLHSFFGGLDGDGVYLEQAAAVNRLMLSYENLSVPNEERFNTWSVPPTVVVTPAAGPSGPGGPGGPGGGGVGGMPEAGGLGPAGGSGIAAALAPGAGAGAAGAGGAALPGAAGSPGPGGAAPGATSGGGTGASPGGVGSPVGGSGVGGIGAPGVGAPGVGMPGSGVPGSGGAGTGRPPGVVGGVGPGAPGPGSLGTGAGAAGTGRPGAGGSGTALGGRGLGTGGVAHPSQRPLGSPGGSGTGPGPWSRAGTEAGRSPAGAAPIRPVVPPRTSTPDWRSVLLPPEREASASTRTPGEASARSAGPGAPGGGTATSAAASAQGSGARGAGSPGMHPPMMGGGAGGAQPEGRRRASYLVDDSDAFVDKRWFTEPVITPDDPL